VSDNTC